jgi:hypothetical protein
MPSKTVLRVHSSSANPALLWEHLWGSVMWGQQEGVFHPLYCLPNNWIPKDLPLPFTPYLSISQRRIKSCEESIYVLILGLGLLLDIGL